MSQLSVQEMICGECGNKYARSGEEQAFFI